MIREYLRLSRPGINRQQGQDRPPSLRAKHSAKAEPVLGALAV